MTVFAPGTFTGKTTTWPVAGALLSVVRHTSAKAVPAHTHEAPYYSLLLDGSYRESAPDFDVQYEPYTLVFHAAQTEHSDSIGPGGCRMFFVELLSPWIETIDELGGSPVHLFELSAGDAIWLMLRLYREFTRREASSEAGIQSLLFELCAYAAHGTIDDIHEPGWLLRLDALLQKGFRSQVDLRELASQVGAHPAHVCRTYRRFRDRTIGDAVLALRIQYVCRRLAESRDSLAQIAQSAGFVDQSHMSRAFKRLTGYSPGVHRRSLTQGDPALTAVK